MATTDSHKFQLDQKDGLHDGLWKEFDEDGTLTETETKTYRNGEVVDMNAHP